MLKIFKDHPQGISILDDFDFYEEKANARRVQKRENSESTHQATFSENLESMVCTCRAVTLLLGNILKNIDMYFIIDGAPLSPEVCRYVMSPRM